jgi:hypothetical protein
MHCQLIAYTKSFDKSLTSADLKLIILNEQQMIFINYYEYLVDSCSKVMPLFFLTQALSMCIIRSLWWLIVFKTLRPIYTWVQFRIRLAHFPKYKNNYILKNGLAYCEIALRNRTCKQTFSHVCWKRVGGKEY